MKNPIFKTTFRASYCERRGGGGYSDAQYVRVSDRSGFVPSDTSTYLGFRIFRTKSS